MNNEQKLILYGIIACFVAVILTLGTREKDKNPYQVVMVGSILWPIVMLVVIITRITRLTKRF